MPTCHRYLAAIVCLFFGATASFGQEKPPNDGKYIPIVQHFEAWGLMKTSTDKAEMYFGFTNGFFVYRGPGKTTFVQLSDCVSYHTTPQQAIAMIDKYYKDNPQRWQASFAEGIVEALTVPDGPCPGLNPLN